MIQNNDTEKLTTELDEEAKDNQKYLSDLDLKLEQLDQRYAQMEIDEERDYLKLAKKYLKKE